MPLRAQRETKDTSDSTELFWAYFECCKQTNLITFLTTILGRSEDGYRGRHEEMVEGKSRVYLYFFSQDLKLSYCYNYPPTDCTSCFKCLQSQKYYNPTKKPTTLTKKLEKEKTGGSMTVIACIFFERGLFFKKNLSLHSKTNRLDFSTPDLKDWKHHF